MGDCGRCMQPNERSSARSVAASAMRTTFRCVPVPLAFELGLHAGHGWAEWKNGATSTASCQRPMDDAEIYQEGIAHLGFAREREGIVHCS